MQILSNIGCLATCTGNEGQAEIQPMHNAALVWENDVVLWVGHEDALPAHYAKAERMDAGGKLVVPGLIDCHTHLAFGGWRSDEFEMRAMGKGYLEIAKAGGGIGATVRHTRAASEQELYDKAYPILDEMMALGITTVECKSGYGLTLEDELKLLQVYAKLDKSHPMRIRSTLLAAHIVPAEYADRRGAYIRMIIDELIPSVAEEGLAQYCDVFVEETAFYENEAIEILDAAKLHGLRPKLHVDQLHDGGGAALAARVEAISADHLEHAAAEGIRAMAEKDVVAVSLPFASFNLRQPAMPARAFIDAGVKVAVSTDFNPGSAPSYHLPAAMYMACVMQQMSPAEVLMGATRFASQAIGMENLTGQLAPGYKADFALIDSPDINHWMGHFRPNANLVTVIDGRVTYKAL
ncbi:MAG: imidazolonepropionase [Rhodothermales bacterium]